jgi:hypothetical protein
VTGYLIYDVNVARLDDLHRRAERRLAVRSARTPADTQSAADPITIRRATAADRATVQRLAALDSAPAPAGEVLLAEVAGQALGAIEIASGAAIADPFRPTAELVELLRVQTARLRAAANPRRPRLRLRLRWAYRAA